MPSEIKYRIACWMSEKKSNKFDWSEFRTECLKHGFELSVVSLEKPLSDSPPFNIFLHKLTDIIASAKEGNIPNINKLKHIEDYLSMNSTIAVIDPIDRVKNLLDRYESYKTIRSTNLHKIGVFTPNFCTLQCQNIEEIKKCLQEAHVSYPFICKAVLGHGSKESHKMSIIFNEDQLKDCKIPCVAQSFINHNAVLYKIFLVGDNHHFVKRPSIKNFHSINHEMITFLSGDVSKAGVNNKLCELDPSDKLDLECKPDATIFTLIAKSIRKSFQMDLLGVDVVISHQTNRYAIIDVNSFPGYDGFPNFFQCLLQCIAKKL